MPLIEKTDSIKDQMVEMTKKNSLSREEKEELVENTSDEWRMESYEMEDKFREVGVPICQDNNGDLFVPEEQKGKGTSVYISDTVCKENNAEKVGTFHTHPTPPVSPSTPDLKVMQREQDKLGCIGTMVDEKATIICFEGEDMGGDLELKRTVQGLMTGTTTRERGDEIGKIQAWEDQSPSAREILDEGIGIKEVAEQRGETVEEVKEQLRKGNIPPEFHRGAPSKKEEVDIPIYTKESEKEQVRKDVSSVRRNFDNMVVYEE